MPNTVIPDSAANRLAFFKNLKQQITDHAAALKLSPADVAAINALLDPLIAKLQTLVDTDAAQSQASADVEHALGDSRKDLLALFEQLRANPGAKGAIAEAMQILSSKTQRDKNSIKPRIKAEAVPGHVRITGTKNYAELVNIYMRIVGTANWVLVGIKRKKFPFDDQTPLKTPGVPEAREYMARGVINDEEIGEPSDIVQVTFGG